MPVMIERELEHAADKKGLTGERKAKYIYSTMNKIDGAGKKHEHGTKKSAMAEKMGHNPAHGERHRKSQMKYYSGKKFSDKAHGEFDDASWKYARENRLTDKRIF